MSSIAKPYTFSASTTASSSQVNANFDTIYDDYNGNIGSTNIAALGVATSNIANSAVTTPKINDDAVTAAKIDYGGAGTGTWWEEIARTTLTGASDTITVSSIPARKYLKYRATLLATGGTVNIAMTFNGDTGANYARRFSNAGAADTTGTALTNLAMVNAQAAIVSVEFRAINISSQEKLVYWLEGGGTASGAGSIPDRTEGVGKWANTSAQISSITLTNSGTGDYAIDSEVVVLGHN